MSSKGPELLSLSTRRREGYLKAVSRVGLTEKILKNDRICSRHFKSGKPVDLINDTNPDWLPSLHLGHRKSLRAAAIYSPAEKMRMARRKARDARRKEQEAAQSLLLLGAAKEVGSSRSKGPDLECSLGPDGGGDLECSLGLDGGGDLECSVGPDGSDDPQCFMGKVQDANTPTGNSFDETAELKKKIDCQAKVIKDLQQTVQNLTMKIKPPSFSEQTFVSDDYVKFYTGLPNITILKAVFDHVLPAVSLSL